MMLRVQLPVSAQFEDKLKQRMFDYVEQSYEFPDSFARDAAYEFNMREVDMIEEATQELHNMCVEAAGHVIRTGQLSAFGIPAHYHDYIKNSYERQDPSLYGRFDLSYDGVNPPKMLEYNADTPTTLFEAALIQWDWFLDRKKLQPATFGNADQFNSIHETFVDRWKEFQTLPNFPEKVHFFCMTEALEDVMTTAYIEDTAVQAGLKTEFQDVSAIGWDEKRSHFALPETGELITALFKLYPWEYMIKDEFNKAVLKDKTGFLEPAWKGLILSNKKILTTLWKLNEGHPNLLPAYDSAETFGRKPYVRKACLGREGASISVMNSEFAETCEGQYDDSGFVFQAFHRLPDFNGRFPVIGSWVVGDKACGMGIREDKSQITKNSSLFVPHYINT